MFAYKVFHRQYCPLTHKVSVCSKFGTWLLDTAVMGFTAVQQSQACSTHFRAVFTPELAQTHSLVNTRQQQLGRCNAHLREDVANCFESDCVRVEHGAAACAREVVPVHIAHVDVGRSLGHALLQDLKALVDLVAGEEKQKVNQKSIPLFHWAWISVVSMTYHHTPCNI